MTDKDEPIAPLKYRDDGSYYPNEAADSAVLEHLTYSGSKSNEAPGWDYERTLGDLIVDTLVGRPLADDRVTDPEHWESLDHALLQRTALEIKVINHACAAGVLTTDNFDSDEITTSEMCILLRGLARRTRAAAELSRRLRVARWGHPNFGGGTRAEEADRQRAAELGRKEAQNWMSDTESGVTELSSEDWRSRPSRNQRSHGRSNR